MSSFLARQKNRIFGWLVAVRRFLIPHHSRREKIVHPFLWLVKYLVVRSIFLTKHYIARVGIYATQVGWTVSYYFTKLRFYWQTSRVRYFLARTKSYITKTPVQIPWKKTDRFLQPESGEDVVNIVTPTFFDMHGAEMCCGGAERYLIEISRILKSMGYRVAVYQMAFHTKPWIRWYNDLEVRGIPIHDVSLFNRAFHDTVPEAGFTLYFSFALAWPVAYPNSLGISHGIWWDHAAYHYPPNKAARWRKEILGAVRNCLHLISVDTNTINWLRAVDHVQSDKGKYLPNFVDTDLFRPTPKDDTKLVVLYPRRLYEPRGFWLMAKVVPELCERYSNLVFHFVGRADEEETEKVQEFEKRYPGQVRWFTLEPEDMHTAYQQADITVVPTTRSEGTSLSCLEAMASGNAVISTNVGGLSDLVIDLYNGRLIEPKADLLREALEQLINDSPLRKQLQANAREVSLCFDKQQWEIRWRKTFADILPTREERPEQMNPLTFVHPLTQGIAWTQMKQRPQQLFQAIAEERHHAFFITDEKDPPLEELPTAPTKDWLHIVDRFGAFQVTRPIVYIYLAYLYETLDDWPNRTVVYDILDDPAIHKDGERHEGIPEDRNYLYYHNKLLTEADVVLTSSEKLYEAYRPQRPDLLLVPNGVRAEDFQREIQTRPDDLPTDSGRVIGYYGALAEWVDYDLIETVSKLRPKDAFVLIGPTNQQERIDALLEACPNVHHLGQKTYDQLPDYLASFDVAIIPFVLNEITHGVSPIKMFEYLAGGKPVVTTDLRECRNERAVLIGRTAEEFSQQIDVGVERAKDPNYTDQQRERARANSWRMRAKAVIAAVEQRSLEKSKSAAA